MDFINSSQLQSKEAQDSFAAQIMRIMPNGMAPIFAMSGLAKKKFIPNIEHGWWSKTMQFVKATLATAISSNATTAVVLDNVDGILAGSVLRVSVISGTTYSAPELMLVTAVNYATKTCTVQRGFAGTTAKASIAQGTLFVEVGNAFPENSARPKSKAIRPVRSMNYTQIFRNAWDVGGTLAAIKLQVGQDAITENKADCSFFHAAGIEQAVLFGRKSMGTDATSGQPFHTMSGLEAMIEESAPNNITVAGATTNFTQLEAMLDPLFDYRTDGAQGNTRTIYCGSQALRTINKIGRMSGEYQLQEGQTSFGLRFHRFSTTRGVFNLVEHPLLNTNDTWKKMAFVLDLGSFDLMYLTGRDTLHDKYNKRGDITDGADAEGGVLTTECTLEMVNPLANGVIYNLTDAAAG